MPTHTGNPFIDMVLGGRKPTPTDFPNPLNGLPAGNTPAFNPSAPDPRAQSQKPGVMGKLDSFIGTQGGGLLMNLLAQSGYSTMPQSPFGAIGRATLANQEQQTQRARGGLEDEFLRSQIGLNQARALGGVDSGKPQTDLAKLNDDLRFGRLSQKDYDVRRNQILKQDINNNFDRTQALRGEFRKDTDAIQSSLSSLAAARSLSSADNPTAQLAAFISTIKSIDNSVVREGELQAFRNIQSLATKLDELKQKAGAGGFSPTLLKDIDNTITSLEAPLSELLDKRKEFYRADAVRFDVNPDSVAGIPFSQVTPSTRNGIPTTPVDPAAESAALQTEIARIEAELAEVNAQLAGQ